MNSRFVFAEVFLLGFDGGAEGESTYKDVGEDRSTAYATSHSARTNPYSFAVLSRDRCLAGWRGLRA